MEVWELVAREAIRDTVARYAHCADRGRFEELAALFTDDGVLEIEGQPLIQGRTAIIAFLAGTKSSLTAALERPLIRHHTSSLAIEVAGPDEAQAWSYFLAITQRGVDHWGRYRDRLQRAGNRWLFRHRRVHPEGHAADSWRAARRQSP